MRERWLPTLRFTLVLMLLTGGLYPVLVTRLAQAMFYLNQIIVALASARAY